MSYTPPADPYSSPPQPLRPEDEKLWSTLTHLGGIVFNFVPALVVYLLFKDRGPFIRAHSQTALNFQLTLLIADVIGGATTFLGIGFLILLAVFVLRVVFGILAALAANSGRFYRYPATIEFIK
jgi:uncharacterized Tic20 family protein